MYEFLGGPDFDPGLVGPNGKLCRLHKGPKPQKPSAQQLKLERQQIALVNAQLAEMERQRLLPTPEAPKPLASVAPVVTQSAADMEQAAADARRAALRRNAPARNTIFAGESGGNLGGRKTILG
jgi:hypothetical protein